MGDSTVVAMTAHTFLAIARATTITTFTTFGKCQSGAEVGGSRRKWVVAVAAECDVNLVVVLLHLSARCELDVARPYASRADR
jgi:hypothetical protein